MHIAINEFLELWNTLLTISINRKYTGKGLPVKAVKRFIGMLNTAETMNVKFTVKQLYLMTSIIKDYWQEKPNPMWNDLFNKLNEK